jgi:hypothetical protein
MLTEAEAYARIVFHLPWVVGEPAPATWLSKRDNEAMQPWLVERPIRVYLLLMEFAPQQLLLMLEVVWPAAVKHLLDDPVLNAIDEQDAPRIFGREAFAKRAHAARLRTIGNLHDMVISLWRNVAPDASGCACAPMECEAHS